MKQILQLRTDELTTDSQQKNGTTPHAVRFKFTLTLEIRGVELRAFT